MKVLHVVGNEIEPTNGIGRLLPEMIVNHNLLSENLEASLLCLSGNYTNPDFCVFSLFDIKSYDVFFKKFDLIVFHGCYYFKYIGISLCLRKLSIPYIIKPHSSLMLSGQLKSKWKKKIANFLLFRRFFVKSNGVLFTNKDEMINSLSWSKHWYEEPNGLDFSSYSPTIKTRKPNEHLKFIYLSRIDFSHKGTDLLLDALSIIKKRGLLNQIELDVYGKGAKVEEDIVKTRISELNSDRIQFKGPVYSDEKISAYNNHDIFILTSRYEGFPMAILEALHFGLPCIVTPGANMSSILNSNDVGWLTEATSDSIADAIIEASSILNDNLSEMSISASKYVHEHHNWKQVVKISESIYSNVVKEEK